MNMHFVDWAILGIAIAGLLTVLFVCKKFVKSTADFLVANRCAGRYLLSISQGISGLGAVSIIAMFELYYTAGFVPLWWGMMTAPVGIVIAATGWVYYRYRETRCMTIAQFFELRYNRSFRILSGIMAWLSGILNYGIFPAVSSNFMIYYCGIPESCQIWGIEISTFPALMAFFLFLGAYFACAGGQIAIMISDFIQGVFCYSVFLIILGFLIWRFGLLGQETVTVLLQAPADASLVNPLKSLKVKDFNFWYYAIAVFGAFYACGSWQGSGGYSGAARNPHEAKMANLIGNLRNLILTIMMAFIPICAYTVM
ncbi:MAG: hypothetical protein WC071_04175, partial [Victivallaceae bacterium]